MQGEGIMFEIKPQPEKVHFSNSKQHRHISYVKKNKAGGVRNLQCWIR